MMSDVMLEQVVELALQLSPVDKVRLLERIASTLKADVESSAKKPLETFEGALAHLGPAPSDEDIAEVRHEMWDNFPREDV